MQSLLRWRSWSVAASIAVLAFLAACSGGGNPTPNGTAAGPAAQPSAPADCSASNTAGCGTVLVAVTDADGDFVSYSVDVLSVTLHRAGGGSVELLPAATRIDFAQLTELADLLSAATVAPGELVGGTIRLDYRNAEVFVESGGEIAAAEVVGADGRPLTVAELEIRLADRNHLIVTRGRTAFLSLDFDLAASHTVDLTHSPAVVTALPYIVAEVAPVEEKQLRLRGALVAVDTADSSYTIDVRPWHRRDGVHGRVTVHVTPQTAFEIGADSYTGAAGLSALGSEPAGTLTVAFGTLDIASRDFTAAVVHAAESVGGERIDAVHGSIVARTNDRLTIKGALAVPRDRAARFHRTVLVDLDSETQVVKLGAPGIVLDTGALSVGQHVVAFGTLRLPAAADEPSVLDAARVRMLPTHLHGAVMGTVPGQLNLRLRAIDRLGIGLFDFSGTGATPALDADPNDYEIATGTLGLTAFEVGEAAKVIGFVQPFGAGPPDFDGRTVIGARDLAAAVVIGWGMSGTTAPFTMLGPDGLAFDLTNPSIGARHHLIVGRRAVDLLDLPASPTVVAQTAGRAMFGLAAPGRIELFADFDAFVAKLTARLAGGTPARAFAAYGAYRDFENRLTANRIVVHLESLD